MKTPPSFLSLLVVLVCAVTLTSCEPVANRHSEVEVAPGEWLPIEGAEGRAWFRCQWKGKTVYWAGHYYNGQAGYYDIQFPVCLRSWEEDLFLIYREDDFPKNLTHFKYCRLGPDGTVFDEIKREAFPRQIATQNMSLHLEGIKHDENDRVVNRLAILRALDVANPHFHNSTTGWIWYHLETGRTREELDNLTSEETLAFYTDFVKKYHPIPLPTIERPTARIEAEKSR